MEILDIEILYEDNDVLVINKPYGVVVNRANTVKAETIQDWAEKRQKSTETINKLNNTDGTDWKLFNERSGIAHRLDKNTSGCLLIAKHPIALESLLSQFKNRETKKEYTALVYGKVTPEQATVQVPIGRLPWRRGLFGVMPGGKHAITHYVVRKNYVRDNQDYSLLSVTIETGRTHQIRVHLQYIDHPIVGDEFYSGKKRARRAQVWCMRMFLHASKLSFKQPSTEKIIVVECPLPAELSRILEKLVKIH